MRSVETSWTRLNCPRSRSETNRARLNGPNTRPRLRMKYGLVFAWIIGITQFDTCRLVPCWRMSFTKRLKANMRIPRAGWMVSVTFHCPADLAQFATGGTAAVRVAVAPWPTMPTGCRLLDHDFDPALAAGWPLAGTTIQSEEPGFTFKLAAARHSQRPCGSVAKPTDRRYVFEKSDC